MSTKKQPVAEVAAEAPTPPYPGGGSWTWSGTEWVRSGTEPAAPDAEATPPKE